MRDKAVREQEGELLRRDPTRGTITPLTLALDTSCPNSRIFYRGLSAREMWSQQDVNKNVRFLSMSSNWSSNSPVYTT